MDFYYNIAYNNPDEAIFVCRKYGYGTNVNTVEELAQSCRTMVASEGEPALVDLMKAHPDKQIILELFEKKNDIQKSEDAVKVGSVQEKMNAEGSGANGNLVNMTNTYILVSAVIIAFAILSIKK